MKTTQEDRHYRRTLWGWEVIILSLENVDLAVARVAARVAQGGHAVQRR